MKITSLIIVGFLATAGLAQVSFAQHSDAGRNTPVWNLEKKSHLGIEGYDPVAYFPEGGGAPAKGDKTISTEYHGAMYYFTTAAHRDAFLADPAKYEPAYGGWCAWAMREGEKVEVDPKSFIVKDGRLFLFYDGILANTRSKWLKGDHAAEASTADASWLKLSGESARMPGTHSLKARLDATREAMGAKLPAETAALFEKGIKDVAASGVLNTALKVGAKAPDFELPDASGKTVSLSSLLTKGPVVVTWYRGAWCPYCNLQLHAYQESLEQFTAAGATLVAISPQTPDNSLTTIEKQHLAFPVLSDKGNAVATKFGLTYTLPPDLAEVYQKMINLQKFNGDASNQLPVSATYVIDQKGTVAWAFVDADYRNRAETADILKALAALRPAK